MAPRPYWSGQLRVSLVSFPVQLFSATTSENQIQLNQIHRPSGQRIKYEKIVSELGPVDETEIVKGYEYAKGAHVLLRQEEIDDLKLESKKTIDLVRFVDADAFDSRYFEKPYYLTPDGEPAEEAYAIIRDALRSAKKIGVGQLILNGRSHIVAVMPFETGLLLEMLRSAEELRSADAFFDDFDEPEPDKEAVAMAEALIERAAGGFEPKDYPDEYNIAMRALIDAKIGRSKPVVVQTPSAPAGNIINIMDALKQSMSNAKRLSGAKASEAVRTRAAGKSERTPAASPSPTSPSRGGPKRTPRPSAKR